MFNKQLKEKLKDKQKKIDDLRWNLIELKAKIWKYENKPEYNEGDHIKWVYRTGGDVSGCDCVEGEIIGIEHERVHNYTNDWVYVILEEGCVTRTVMERSIYRDLNKGK